MQYLYKHLDFRNYYPAITIGGIIKELNKLGANGYKIIHISNGGLIFILMKEIPSKDKIRKCHK
jgi:hypothetical protein